MTGLQLAALLLSLALLVMPPSPRSRLVPTRQAHRVIVDSPWVVGGVCLCGLVVAILLLPLTTVLALAFGAATMGLRGWRRRRHRRGTAEGLALQAGLAVLVGELRVGAHPVHAFDVAADETDGSVSGSLRTVAARARMGADVAAGLRSAGDSSALPRHWERLAICWQLASEHGLAIATLMRAAQRDITARQQFSAKVASSLAGARATAAILAGLPVLGVLLGELLGARPLRFLLGTGGWFLVIGLALTCTGVLWSDRITDRVVST
ncbi:type II secretion system F family protein [Mycobacterium asiaticum]|uniref:Type II secretion system protein GspF domain-containing protein n=1 Tax=Mycobacterium asiaticum TaxID=1790 RepID=A0A1A3CWV1_MYCAS|nr:type II secretion system F family protein [Mycobacterium asiaticum]OBI90847.1 hypothetical protein A9X01_10970 [Mycobacterium asiaticum]